MLNGKLKNLLNAATGYTLNVTGDKVVVTLTGAAEKKLMLTLVPGSRAEVWLVGGID